MSSRHNFPRVVAGIAAPDSRFVRLAVEQAHESLEPVLLNHSARTFFLGALIGNARNQKVDLEILMVACLFHDLGLSPLYEGGLPFEIQGAQAAKSILSTAGYPQEKCDLVWDGIAMHTQVLADFKRPEIALVSAGAGADVTGSDLEFIGPEDVEAVVRTFPRLDFKNAFVACCAEVVKKYPNAARRSFMRDIGERLVPGFKPLNICDRIKTAPFKE